MIFIILNYSILKRIAINQENQAAQAEYDYWTQVQQARAKAQEVDVERNEIEPTSNVEETPTEEIKEELREDTSFVDNGVSEWYSNVHISGELDQNDSPFLISLNGEIDFREITSMHNLPAAPIRLAMGNIENGYIHINRRHGKEIQTAGFESIEDFVKFVADNFTRIQKGEAYENAVGSKNQTYLIQLQDKSNNTLFVQLSRDGKYWNVNSAEYLRRSMGIVKKIFGLLPKCRMTIRLLSVTVCSPSLMPIVALPLTELRPILSLPPKVQS